MVEIMVALWVAELQNGDRLSVEPQASPVRHAISSLLGDLDERYPSTLRALVGPVEALAACPEDEVLRERRRAQAVAGGYRITTRDPGQEQVTLAGVGAIVPEVVAAAERFATAGSPPGWSA